MPRPALPPTPGSSSDIRGKDGMQQLSSLQLAFELPPPAIHDAAADASRISPVDSKQQQLSPLSTPSLGLDVATSPKTVVYPMQAAETVKSRRRSSAATTKEPKENTFALPPPPTRSRKIIQMKPRTQDTAAASASTKESSARAAGKAAAAKTAAPGPDAGAGAGGASAKGESTTKKKQPSATSAAGRKIARKTAHSLIERRRRSKMNEEFALLKSMIPACTGEMHKLAILQASIEYVRYLEDCVAKLKAQQEQSQSSRPEASHSPLPPIREFHPTFHEDPADVEMTDSEAAASPVFAPQRPSVSPALHAQDSRHRQHSYSSVSTDQRHYSYSASTTTSPAFGPQMFANNGGGTGYTHSSTSASGSTLTSPALLPQTDLDHEATAALLMLNSDRRGATANNNRALSVRDLLSS
ncbi:hypothetical protein THAR02_06697 [Trichoderma harzianum]|uniref:BHLH domain-containing protein n=1 Tax=Trichoderma harzianum TaxID=5544 RepID=A0A0F9X9K6_TRIHA|nr:hypothetical protein THAR02_06697 [Trichoderma harzianum]